MANRMVSNANRIVPNGKNKGKGYEMDIFSPKMKGINDKISQGWRSSCSLTTDL